MKSKDHKDVNFTFKNIEVFLYPNILLSKINLTISKTYFKINR